jgi:hypothetical protein
LSSWARGLNEHKTLVEDSLRRADTLAREGNVREAQRVLTLAVMYVESVQRMGVRRGGQYVSLETFPAFDRMRGALRAVADGNSTVGDRGAYDVFGESYNGVQLEYVRRESDRLEAYAGARGREFAREDVNLAIAEARNRASRGDYPGAIILLEYVREFYGIASPEIPASGASARVPARSEGWRYEIFTGSGAARVPGYESGRRDMLEAMRLEINSTDESTRRSAATLFQGGAARIADTQMLIQNHRAFNDRFMGRSAFVPGDSETVGRIPLERSGSEPQQYINLSDIRAYEAAHPRDTELGSGPTLEALMQRVERAAQRGDIAAYNRAVDAFQARLQLVTTRTMRQGNIATLRTQIRESRTAIAQLRAHYDDPVYSGARRAQATERQRAIDAIVARLDAFERTLGTLENAGGDIPLRDYTGILTDLNRESRIGQTLVYLNTQISQNEQFRQAVASERSDRAAGIARTLVRAGGHYSEARDFLLAGNLESAYQSYRSAISAKQDALIFYRAEDSPHIDQVDMGDVVTLVPLPRPRPTDISPTGLDLRFHPVLRYQYASREFDFYRTGSLQVFSQLLTGSADGFSDADGGRRVTLNSSPTRTLGAQRLEDIARALAITEVSTFAAPQGEVRSMLLTDYAPRQMEMRRHMRGIVETGYAGEAGRQLTEGYFQMATRNLEWIQSRYERDRKIEMYTMIGVGFAALFIPKVGWAISGAIFTAMAWDRVQMEIRVNGHASTEAWVMFGLTVGTLGLGAVGGVTRIASGAAQTAGRVTLATRLATATTVINVTNLTIGVGMMGYGTYSGIQALRAGRTEEGVLNLGMAAFGGFMIGRAGISAYSSYRAQVRARAASFEALQVLENAIPRQAEGQARITPTDVPEVSLARSISEPRALLRFIRGFSRASAQAREVLLSSLPRHVRPIVERLAADPRVLNAADEIAGGRTPINMRSINEVLSAAIRGFDIPPPQGPSGGPRGTRPQIDTAGLLNPDGLRGFLSDLLIPDGAPQPALAQRAAARARLASIRQAHPEVGTVIDGLLQNPSLAAEFHGQSSPFTQRATHRAVTGANERIGRLIPDDVIAAEQQAYGQYVQHVEGNLALQPEIVPQEVPNPQPEFGGGGGRMPPIRASGGEGGRPPVVVAPPVRTGGAGEGGEGPVPRTPRQAPREPVRQGEPQVQPQEPARGQTQRQMDPETLLYPGEQGRVPGRLTLWGRSIANRWRQYRAGRAERGQATTVPEDFVSTARRGIEDTIGSVAPSAQMETIVGAAQEAVPAHAAPEVGGFVRSAPGRLTSIVKTLYSTATAPRPRGVDAAQYRLRQEVAWRALIRIMSHPNVRAAFTEAAAADAELARIIRGADTALATSARARGLTTGALREALTRQAMPNDELLLLIENLERGVGMRDPANARNFLSVSDIRARIDQLETTRIPQLEQQIAAQRRAAQAATGRAQTRAQARVQALETELAGVRSQLETYVNFIRNPANSPLATTQRILGTDFASGGGTRVGQEVLPPNTVNTPESVLMLLRLNETGTVPNDAVLGAYVDSGRAAIGAIRAIPTEGRSPVVQVLAQGLERAVGTGGSVDDAILAIFRSEELLGAIRSRHGPRAAEAFREAAAAGNLDEVLGRLARLEVPGDAARGLGSYATTARRVVADHFTVMSALDPRVISIMGEAMEGAGGVGRLATRTAPQAVGEWWGQSWARRVLRGAMWDIPVRGQYRFLQQGRQILRTAPGESPLAVGRMGGYARIGLQAAIWGLEIYAVYHYVWPGIYEALTGSSTIQQGREDVRRTWGISISEDNARFVRTDQGGEYFRYLPNLFPYSYNPPGNAQDLRRELDRNEIIIDPRRIDQVLSDGRAMGGRLDEINRLLETRRAGGDGAADATRRLTEILSGFGMTIDALDRLLTRERKQQIDITDMAELRMDDWVRRGVAIRYRDFVIEDFLQNCGITIQRGQGAAAFLTQNTDVFVFLWQGVQGGTIPINYMDDAIAILQRDGVLSGIRSRVSGTITLDSQLRETLMREHLYIEVPAGRGQVEGIRQNSFLGILDIRASQDATFRPVFERILSTYRENPQALAAFNRFNLVEGENGEAIYGDAEALARLIIENPDTALARARTAGHVGPKVLGAMQDPSGGSLYYPNLEPAIVQFVQTHSGEQSGLRQWLIRHREQITNMPAIVRFLSESSQAAAMDSGAIENFATQNARTFRDRGWWRGPTPQERAQAEEDARRQAGTPTGGGPGRREPSREELLQDRSRQRNPRRPGFEMAPQDQPEERAAPQVQAPPQLTQEARQFYESDRAAGLGAALEGRLTRMYSDARGDGRPNGPLRQTFGEPTTDASGQVVIPQRALQEVQAEVYRFLTSTNPVEVRLRESWGIRVSGTGPALRLEIPNMRTTGEALQNYIIEYANRRVRAQSGSR